MSPSMVVRVRQQPPAAVSRRWRLPAAVFCIALAACASATAQGGPPGGAGGGFHGRRPSSPGAEHRPPPPMEKQATEPLEALLGAARELRQGLMLEVTQTQRWNALLDDLRDVLDKRKALAPRPSDDPLVPNPALLYVQDRASSEGALAAALNRLSGSMQAAVDSLDERQRKVAVEKMTAALHTVDALP